MRRAEKRIGLRVGGVVHVHGRRRIGDVQQHESGVPVRYEHVDPAIDLLHPHIVVEGNSVGRARSGRLRVTRLGPLRETGFRDQSRPSGVGDFEDVHVPTILVVHEHGVGAAAPLPRDRAVGGMSVALSRSLTRADNQQPRPARISYIPQRNPAIRLAAPPTRLVRHHEHISPEALGLHVEDEDTLRDIVMAARRDESHLLGMSGVLDADHVDARVRALRDPPAKVGEPLVYIHVANPSASIGQAEFRDEDHVPAGTPRGSVGFTGDEGRRGQGEGTNADGGAEYLPQLEAPIPWGIAAPTMRRRSGEDSPST
jgi:hypothetical protein